MFLTRGKAIAVLFLLLMIVLSPLTANAVTEEAVWTQMNDMPAASSEFTYATLPDGREFVSMGGDMFGEISKRTWLFDPNADTWVEVEESPFGYMGASAVAMPDGKVYLFGGAYLNIGLFAQEKVLIYDLVSNSWAFGVDIPEAMFYLEAVALDDERILLIGGFDPVSFETIENCWIYSTEREVFEAALALPSARAAGVAVRAGSSVYYVGGTDLTLVGQEEVFRYDIPTGMWELAGRMPEGRYYDNGVLGDDGLLYMYGGKTGASTSLADAGTMRVVDLRDCSFVSYPEPPLAAKAGGVMTTADGRFIIMGGVKGSDPVAVVYSLNIFSQEVWMDASECAPGEGVRLYAQVEVNLVDDEALTAEVYLVKDNVTYASYHMQGAGGGAASVLIALPEDLFPGDYQLLLRNVDTGVGVQSQVDFEPLTLTVTNAPSPTDRIEELQDQLNRTQQELADLQESMDELQKQKMDAAIGYVILMAVIACLLVSLFVLIRKK